MIKKNICLKVIVKKNKKDSFYFSEKTGKCMKIIVKKYLKTIVFEKKVLE